MTTRRLTVLGTSSQVPTRRRNHNGLFVAWDGQGVLFDPGEGTQRQMLRYGVSAHRLHHIAITHTHGDHCLGLPGVLQRLSLDEVPHPVTVHHAASETPWIERLRHASRYVDHADVRMAPFSETAPLSALAPLGRDGTSVLRTARLDHTVPTWGYRIDEPDGWTLDAHGAAAAGVDGADRATLLREGSVRVGDRVVRREEVATRRPGQSVAVVMDTRPCEGAEALAGGVDLLICESTYLDDMRDEARARGHMTARQAAELARSAGARRLVLTQFSQRYPDEQGFLAEAAAIHDDVVAAHDGLEVDLPPRRLWPHTP